MTSAHPEFPNLVVFDHPLIRHKLTQIRDERTEYRGFRALMREIGGLMVFEVTRTFPSEPVRVRTPLEEVVGSRLHGKITVCPVLRAGLGMAEGVLDIMPEARLGHIGLHRNEETLEPETYLSKLPADLDAGPVILVDPMLATGGSAGRAISLLKEAGARDVRMIALVVAPEGVSLLGEVHPDVTIYTAALDRQLDARGFIVPGLGDAGDRMYGTA